MKLSEINGLGKMMQESTSGGGAGRTSGGSGGGASTGRAVSRGPSERALDRAATTRVVAATQQRAAGRAAAGRVAAQGGTPAQQAAAARTAVRQTQVAQSSPAGKATLNAQTNAVLNAERQIAATAARNLSSNKPTVPASTDLGVRVPAAATPLRTLNPGEVVTMSPAGTGLTLLKPMPIAPGTLGPTTNVAVMTPDISSIFGGAPKLPTRTPDVLTPAAGGSTPLTTPAASGTIAITPQATASGTSVPDGTTVISDTKVTPTVTRSETIAPQSAPAPTTATATGEGEIFRTGSGGGGGGGSTGPEAPMETGVANQAVMDSAPPMIQPEAAPPAPVASEPKKTNIAALVAGAGTGFLVGGPVGALIGAGAAAFLTGKK